MHLFGYLLDEEDSGDVEGDVGGGTGNDQG